MRLKTMVLLLLVAISVPAAYGNHLHFETFHVFPQVADGRFGDNSYYRTTFNVLPFFSDANCVLTLHGLTADFGGGYVSGVSVFVPANGFVSIRTTAAGPIQTGYATLTCDEPTYANAVYSAHAPSGVKLAEATVFSSVESFFQTILVDGRDGARLGFAIANDDDIPRTYELTLTDSIGSVVSMGTVDVPARSNAAQFIDQLMIVPAGQVLMLSIEDANFNEFAAMGLRYTGGVFTTVPAQ